MPGRLLFALALLIASASLTLAEIPSQIAENSTPEPLDSADFILTLPVARSAKDTEILFALRGAEGSALEVLRVTGDAVDLARVEDGTVTRLGRRGAKLPAVGSSFDLTVHARGPHLVVSADGNMLAHFLREGSLSARVGAWATQGATVGDLLVQPLGEVTFDEDFFATEQVPDRWETLAGQWQVGIYWDPLQERDNRPIGASWYAPGEGECLTASGYGIFDSYRLAATVRLPQGRGGLAFHVWGPEDYCAFELGQGQARLVQVSGGARKVLAETAAELRPEWSYRLRVDVSTGLARAFLNDQPLVEADLSPALTGRIGLLAEGAAGSRFDDIIARPFIATRIPKGAPAEESLVLADGTWKTDGDALTGHVKGAAVAGLPGSYADCEVTARVGATRDAVAGVVAGHRTDEPKSALIFTIKAGVQPTWQLHQVNGGQTVRLAGGPSPAAGGLMTLRVVGGRVSCLLDGAVLHEGCVSGQRPGRAGVYLQGGRATFARLSAATLSDEPQAIICRADGDNAPIPAVVEAATIRPIGNLWRPRGGSWRCQQTQSGPRIVATGSTPDSTATLRFHEVTPGDPRLIVEADPGGGSVSLGICMGDEPGYQAQFPPERDRVRLLRRGEVVYESAPGSEGNCTPGEIRRRGEWIVVSGSGNEPAHWAWRDPEPLPDGYAEVSVMGAEARFASITLAGDDALAYRFDRVEPDWQPRTGEWDDHTGMACILWDYWMTGDGREEPAFTWNRRVLPDDVTLDVSAAEFTEGHETGHHEHFAYHDVSVILGGTPGDPDSGYRFVVGADRGARNVLLRNGVEVAASNDYRCRIAMGGHCNTPRAVRIRAQRAGDEVSLTFNGIEAIRWTDPEPLSGGGNVGLGCAGCRVLFRDCVIYPGVRE